MVGKNCREEIAEAYRNNENAVGFAFVIGIDGCVSDVEEMSTTFENLNFAVMKQPNMSIQKLESYIKAATKYRFKNYKFIAFYVSGHGTIDDEGRPCIVQADEIKKSIEECIVSPFTDVLQEKKCLFFLDCFSSKEHMGAKQMKFTFRPHKQTLIACSSSQIMVASEGSESDRKCWTRHLLETLKSDQPLTAILDHIYDQVVKETTRKKAIQTPYYVSCIAPVSLGKTAKAHIVHGTENKNTRGECTVFKQYHGVYKYCT